MHSSFHLLVILKEDRNIGTQSILKAYLTVDLRGSSALKS